MEREEFWGLIAGLGPDHDVDVLRASLATHSGQEIFSFWDHLVACVSKLNTEEFFDQTPVDVGDDPANPLPLGDDAFLDARIAVVAHGRKTYEAVQSDPSEFGAVWPFELGEELVAAVSEAFEESTGEPWPSLNPDTEPPSELPRSRRYHWLSVSVWDHHRTGNHVRPGKPYDAHMNYLEHLLNEDQRWWHWWDQARGEESYLTFEVSPKPVTQRRTTLRTGRDSLDYDEVTVVVRVPETEFAQPLTADTPALGWAMLARAHFDLLFAKLEAKLNLEVPAWLSTNTAQLEMQRRQWKAAEERRYQEEDRAEEAWQRHRSSEHIWRGRAPDSAIDQLVVATRAGKRIVALPQMIADLRATHHIPLAADDADRLAEAGYKPNEIAIALGDPKGG